MTVIIKCDYCGKEEDGEYLGVEGWHGTETLEYYNLEGREESVVLCDTQCWDDFCKKHNIERYMPEWGTHPVHQGYRQIETE